MAALLARLQPSVSHILQPTLFRTAGDISNSDFYYVLRKYYSYGSDLTFRSGIDASLLVLSYSWVPIMHLGTKGFRMLSSRHIIF